MSGAENGLALRRIPSRRKALIAPTENNGSDGHEDDSEDEVGEPDARRKDPVEKPDGPDDGENGGDGANGSYENAENKGSSSDDERAGGSIPHGLHDCDDRVGGLRWPVTRTAFRTGSGRGSHARLCVIGPERLHEWKPYLSTRRLIPIDSKFG